LWQRCAILEPGADALLVIDASALVQACLSEADLEGLGGHDLIAPPLLWSEATSVLHELEWRRDLSRQHTDAARGRLARVRIRQRSPKGLHEHAWQVASELGWAKTYDAEYVALARLMRCSLLTVDARLAATAGRLVEIRTPTEL
jgi:predicted nucleic acid-binding protein